MFLDKYWSVSRSITVSCVFALPLWLTYEFLAFFLNKGWGGGSRTGVDFALRSLYAKAGIPMQFGLALPLLVCAIVLFVKRHNHGFGQMRLHYYAWMLLESMFYGAILGILVGAVSGLFLSASGFFSSERFLQFVINLGAGIYEEFVFRFLLLSGIIFLFAKVFNREMAASAIGVFLSALIFAGFHHLEIFDEPFAWRSFLFRFFAGLLFAGLFLFRGFGVAAYTHSFYNIFLIFRLDNNA